MKKFNNKYLAIILSSTYGEDENYLIKFLKHVSEICKAVNYQYSVLPVLVFEKTEEKKKLSIEKKLNPRK